MKGILDRFEGELAVILMEEAKEEITVKKKNLPPGSGINTIFTLTKQEGTYQITGIDSEATAQEKEKSASLTEKLRAKSKGSKFKRR
jgi:hypothetical protein